MTFTGYVKSQQNAARSEQQAVELAAQQVEDWRTRFKRSPSDLDKGSYVWIRVKPEEQGELPFDLAIVKAAWKCGVDEGNLDQDWDSLVQVRFLWRNGKPHKYDGSYFFALESSKTQKKIPVGVATVNRRSIVAHGLEVKNKSRTMYTLTANACRTICKLCPGFSFEKNSKVGKAVLVYNGDESSGDERSSDAESS
jgi:hypothetical protein